MCREGHWLSAQGLLALARCRKTHVVVFRNVDGLLEREDSVVHGEGPPACAALLVDNPRAGSTRAHFEEVTFEVQREQEGRDAAAQGAKRRTAEDEERLTAEMRLQAECESK